MTTVALLLAAGEGRRLGWAIPKAFVPVGGRPMVEYSLIVAFVAIVVVAALTAFGVGVGGLVQTGVDAIP